MSDAEDRELVDPPPRSISIYFSRISIFFNVINTITHVALGTVTIVPLIFVKMGSHSSNFNQHVILCGLGYQLMMAQAILSFDSSNGWSAGLRYQEKKLVHWVMQTAGSCLALAGSIIRMKVLGHFDTPHGILGLIATVLTGVSLVGGAVNLYARTLRLSPKYIKIVHAIVGAATISIANASLCYGFDKSVFRKQFQDFGASFMIALTVIATFGVILDNSETVYQKYVVTEVARMDRPSTSHQTEKVEMFEVQEHVPYRAPVARSSGHYDEESGDIYDDSTWATAWSALCQLYNTLNHMMIAIIVFTIWRFALTAEANGTVSRFELHMVFAGTGFQLFLCEAVLTLHSHNSWSLQLSRDAKRVVHGCFQLIGGLFVIAGTTIALAEVNWRLTTGHGICGLIAFVFTLISMINGIVTLFSNKVKLMVKNGPMKIFHVSTALIGLSVGLITICLGFNMDYFKSSGESLAIAMMVMTILTLAYLLIHPVMNLVTTVKKTL